MKILTIVVPTYNMEVLLPRCLSSLIVKNNYNSLEVIVVNDGSKDNSLSVANSFAIKYPEIVKVVDKDNGNYGSAVNSGIENATGKYIRILDADDYYDTDQLDVFITCLGNCDDDIILTNYSIDRDGSSKQVKIHGLIENISYSLENIKIEDLKNYVMHSLTYKTNILKENGIRLLHGISYTDTEFCYYPLNYSSSLRYFSLSIYHYQVGRSGQTVSLESLIKCESHMRKIILRMFEDLEGTDIASNLYYNKAYVLSRIINLYYSTILCYDHKSAELDYLKSIDNVVRNDEALDGYLRKNDMFGVPFYKRYHDYNKMSNNFFYRVYYNLIKELAILYRQVLSLIRAN